MINMTEAEGDFSLEIKIFFFPSALLADPRIFADRIRIMKLIDPYSIGEIILFVLSFDT